MLDVGADIDACFTADEKTLGFASLVRCGLGKETKRGKYATSGDVVPTAIAVDNPIRRFFNACTERFLKTISPSVRVVVFLGLDKSYVEALFQRVCELHPNVRRISDLAYATDAATFVHVIHPSPLATSHRQKWLRNDDGALAEKRRQVRAALGKVYQRDPELLVEARPRPVAKSARSPRTSAARASEPTAKNDDLIAIVRDAIRGGALDAEEIGNSRERSDEVKKIFRVKRGDGEEFAIQRTGNEHRLWSSVPPGADTPRASPAQEYPPERTRHSNLGVLPKLRGPKNGRPGASAWLLHFATSSAVLEFIIKA